jgi:hypothetical protein
MSKTYRLFLLPCLTALVAACSTGNPDETGRRTLQRVAPVVVERPAVAGVDGPVGMTRVNTPASAWTGAASITRRTADVMVDQTRRGEVAMDWRTRPRAGKLKPARTLLSQGPLTLAPAAADAPAVVDRGSAPAVAQTAASPNVDVATIADTGALPPDTMGDIGPTQYLVGLNGRIRTIAKSTGVADGALDADTDVFFPAAVRGAGVTTDPRVRYDRRTNRWFVLMITIAVPNRFVVAVSDGPTISAGTVWAQYQWANTREAGSGAFGCLADYPSLGIDEDALYIGVNQFCGSSFSSLGFDSVSVYVLNKAALVGGALSVAQFDGVLPSRNSNGIYSPQGVDNVDSNTNAGYVIGVDNAFFGSLVLHRISSPGAAPSISAPIAIGVAPTALPVDVPHPGGTLPLDGLDDRLLQAVIRHGRLWTSQQIEVNTTGQAAATGGRNAVRWYELGGLDATPSVVQSGTVFDNTPSNPVHYWMGALMPNGQGHVALGMSTAGATTRVNTAFTGRLATDAAGAMDAPLVYSNNTAFAYNQQSAPETSQRWGDYSYTSVDPDDDMTFWTLQQYVNATDSYAVRLVRLLAPPPPAIQSVSPPSLTTGLAAASVTVTGVAAAGRGFFDPGPTFPRRLVAALGAGVSVTGITASSPTSLVLTVSTVGAAVGVRAVTVTNPDGQASTLAAAFTVTAPGPPVFGGVPADRTLFDTGSGASTGPLAFTVSDPDGTPVELTALSSDPSVVPLDRITFGGAETDVSRSVTVRSSGQYGSSTITMRATSGGQTTTASFLVTVSPSGTATPPQRFAVAVVRNRVTFTWQPPATAADEPVTGYRIEAGYAPGQTVARGPPGPRPGLSALQRARWRLRRPRAGGDGLRCERSLERGGLRRRTGRAAAGATGAPRHRAGHGRVDAVDREPRRADHHRLSGTRRQRAGPDRHRRAAAAGHRPHLHGERAARHLLSARRGGECRRRQRGVERSGARGPARHVHDPGGADRRRRVRAAGAPHPPVERAVTWRHSHDLHRAGGHHERRQRPLRRRAAGRPHHGLGHRRARAVLHPDVRHQRVRRVRAVARDVHDHSVEAAMSDDEWHVPHVRR